MKNQQFEAMSRTVLLARDLIVSGEVSDEDIVSAFMGLTVRLVADTANLHSPTSQTAFVTLFFLLARMGCAIRLTMPSIEMLGIQPPLQGSELRKALLEAGRHLIPGCSVGIDDTPADLTFVLGSSDWAGKDDTWRIGANEWSGWTAPATKDITPITAKYPFGAMAAAGLAAAEPFKAALRHLAKDYKVVIDQDQTRLVPQANFDLAPPSTPALDVNLGHLDAISGGAITNVALFALQRVPGLRGNVRVIEPEALDLSNLNRYMLTRSTDCGLPKVEILRRYSTVDLTIEGVQGYFTEGGDERLGQLAQYAIIGADDIPTRWNAQIAYPEWLSVGATSHFLAMASSHQLGEACAGCLHPYNDPGPALIPTVSFISFWSGILVATRLVRLAIGHPVPISEQAILFWPLVADLPKARIGYMIPGHPKCPVECAAYQGLQAVSNG